MCALAARQATATRPRWPARCGIEGPLGVRRRAQSSQGHHHEAPNRGLRLQGPRTGQSVKAVTGELVSRDIGAELAAFRSLGDEIANHLVKGCLRSCNVLISMNVRRQFAVVPTRLMGEERVSLEHSRESIAC